MRNELKEIKDLVAEAEQLENDLDTIGGIRRAGDALSVSGSKWKNKSVTVKDAGLVQELLSSIEEAKKGRLDEIYAKMKLTD